MASYQARLPGFESVVAREYLAATEADDASADDGPEGSSRYAVIEEIGRGGMGTVYRVEDLRLRRDLAMKVLNRDVAASPNAWSRFLEEAQVTSQLQHPGIVPVHDVGLDATGSPYFTMPLIRGQSFRAILDAVPDGRDAWSLAKAIDVLIRVCDAVAFAHSLGVVHRDLTPSNVMVGEFGEVYVMDWGVAHLLAESSNPRTAVASSRREAAELLPSLRTQDGDIVGTPAYMAPEQASGSAEIGTGTDVFGVGAMLFHLLTGRPPSAVQDPAAEVEELASDRPQELIAICRKAMAAQLGQRYASVRALGDDLRAWRETRVVSAYAAGPWAELCKWIARNRVAAFAITTAIAALVIGLFVSLHLKGRSDDNAARAEQAANTARIEQARLLGLGQLHGAEASLWNSYFSQRSEHAFFALCELYERQGCFASRQSRRPITGLALGPRDAWAVTGHVDGSITVFDGKTLEPLDTLASRRRGRLWCIAGNRRGLVASGNEDGSVTLWDVEARRAIRDLPDDGDGDPTDETSALQFSPDGSMLAVGELDGDIHLWDHQRAALICSFRKHSIAQGGHRGRVAGLRFRRDGKVLASVGDDDRPRLWEIETRTLRTLVDPVQQLRRRQDPDSRATSALEFSVDGKRLWTGGRDRILRTWDLDRGCVLSRTAIHAGTIRTMRASPDGRVLALGCGFRLELRRCSDLSLLRRLPVQLIWSVEFSNDGRTITSAHDAGGVAIFEIESHAVTKLPGHVGRVSSVTSRDGHWIATGDTTGRLRLFDLGTGKLVREFRKPNGEVAHGARIQGLDFDCRGRWLASGSKDGLACVWDRESGTRLQVIEQYDDSSRSSVRFATRGEDLAVALKGGHVAFFDAKSGLESRRIDAVTYQAIGTAFGTSMIATTQRDHSVRLWSMQAEPLAELSTKKTANWSIDFSSDGAVLATGCWDGTIEIYELSAHRRVGVTLPGHLGLVATLVFRPDSAQHFATASSDGAVRVWDASKRRCILELGFPADALSVSWGRGGRSLVVSGEHDEVYVWDLDHLERRVAGHLDEQLDRYLQAHGPVTDEADLRRWASRKLRGR